MVSGNCSVSAGGVLKTLDTQEVADLMDMNKKIWIIFALGYAAGFLSALPFILACA